MRKNPLREVQLPSVARRENCQELLRQGYARLQDALPGTSYALGSIMPLITGLKGQLQKSFLRPDGKTERKRWNFGACQKLTSADCILVRGDSTEYDFEFNVAYKRKGDRTDFTMSRAAKGYRFDCRYKDENYQEGIVTFLLQTAVFFDECHRAIANSTGSAQSPALYYSFTLQYPCG